MVERSSVPNRYAYFQGCAARQSCPELNQATTLVAKHLGWELTTLECAACTGARDLIEAQPDMAVVLNARTLALAESQGLNTLMTVCSTCTITLRQVNKLLKEDRATLDMANHQLGQDRAAIQRHSRGAAFLVGVDRRLRIGPVEGKGEAPSHRPLGGTLLWVPHPTPIGCPRLR